MPIGIDVNAKRLFNVVRAVQLRLATECDYPQVHSIEFFKIIHYEVQMQLLRHRYRAKLTSAVHRPAEGQRKLHQRG